MIHANAPLTATGRLRLAERVVLGGRPIAHVAAEAHIARATLSKWVARYRAGGEGDAPAPALFVKTVEATVKEPAIVQEEMFGPASIIIQYRNEAELKSGIELLEGQLTTIIHAEPQEDVAELVDVLTSLAGRVIWNSWPTGVTVSYAQQHGGPYPATTTPKSTSVGTAAVRRFTRPAPYQAFPEALLPALRGSW